ncbi:hypothetical protein SLS56_001075 [Neofusicoccum ribis]|uniref:D-serine dehydratase-like domain-containing protein n=1 Tax=Neofusicoccum ribis TaxID=45134 RepID=A0ABR3TAJ8_9PEZI
MVDITPQSLEQFIGRPADELPTPAFVLTSTLREIRGLLPLVQEGILEEILYGIPLRPSALPFLHALRTSSGARILLTLDHASQITALEAFNRTAASPAPWPAFIKVDPGYRRAGLAPTSPRLAALVAAAQRSPAVRVRGFYAHAGHSYGARTADDAAAVLRAEVDAALAAAALLDRSADDDDEPVVVSFGATPTAHVVRELLLRAGAAEVPGRGGVRLELHAGNFVANDLQQLGTGCVSAGDLAVRVLAEVCSVYPERGEAVVNAGAIALGRETGPIAGYGRVVGGVGEWIVGRVSQEHGIVTAAAGGEEGVGMVEERFEVGDKVWLHVQHACIAAAAHHYYFVVDDEDVVREVWWPWKGW